MTEQEITHKEIYERVVQLEEKVDRVDKNTAGLVAAFQAAHGAFTVLEWLAKVVKPILWLGGLLTAAAVVWDNLKVK